MQSVIETVNGWVWGPPMMALLLLTGAYLTIGLRLMSIIRIPYGFKQLFRKRTGDEEEGDPAITHYQVIDHVVSSGSWVELKPDTGRTHQLRVHCSTVLGSPILGDYKYGSGVPESLRPVFGKRSNH